MAIETVEDIVEELMDKLGIYGAHDEPICEKKMCRCCAASELRDRLAAAYDIELRLKDAG